MVIDYIKQEISTEICEEGGASARIVNNKVMPLNTSVKEAISGHYVMGDAALIASEATGLIESMVANCAKDGNARQIGDYITVYPQYYGLIDPDVGHNPLVNGVKLNIRLLNELKVDTSGWSFNDVTPGKLPIKVYSASSGDETGVVTNTAAVKMVGYGLNSATRVDWMVEGTAKHGTIAETQLGRTATVLTLPLLSTLDSTCNGKTIAFTVVGSKNSADVTAKVKYVAPPVAPTLTKVYAESNPSAESHIQCFEEINDLIGTDLTNATAIKYTWMSGGEEPVPMEENGEIVSKTDTLLKFKMPEVQFGTSGNLVVTWSGGEVTLSGVTADMPE